MKHHLICGSEDANRDCVLERLSSHLDQLSAKIFELEKSVATHLGSTGKSHHTAIVDFQVLDYLRQSLEDVSLMVLLISRSNPQRPLTPDRLGKKLKLDSTRNILFGSGSESVVHDGPENGEVDLF